MLAQEDLVAQQTAVTAAQEDLVATAALAVTAELVALPTVVTVLVCLAAATEAQQTAATEAQQTVAQVALRTEAQAVRPATVEVHLEVLAVRADLDLLQLFL